MLIIFLENDHSEWGWSTHALGCYRGHEIGCIFSQVRRSNDELLDMRKTEVMCMDRSFDNYRSLSELGLKWLMLGRGNQKACPGHFCSGRGT